MDKLKLVSIDHKKLGHVVDVYVVKKIMHKELVSKIPCIETKVPSTSTPIHKSQFDTNKQNLERSTEHVHKGNTKY